MGTTVLEMKGVIRRMIRERLRRCHPLPSCQKIDYSNGALCSLSGKGTNVCIATLETVCEEEEQSH